MAGSPWRYACPNGHRQVTRRQGSIQAGYGDNWRCLTCGANYAQVRDLKTGRRVRP